jgi:hypothetical protein
MHIANEFLASVFAESSAFCGKEDVLHAVIYHQLKKAGYPHSRIAREQALAGNRVDIVLHGDGVAGDFASTQKKSLAAIEVKGGAYGTRNALKDEIDASGYCTDMTKLKPEAAKGIESWFICVDMPELGRAISPAKAQRVRLLAHIRLWRCPAFARNLLLICCAAGKQDARAARYGRVRWRLRRTF